MIEGSAIGLLFDALVAVLLIATIVYAGILNRKLSNLRALKPEMEVLVARLAESTQIAEKGLQNLRDEVERTGETMQRRVETARGIVDELGFLIEKGDAAARRLDETLSLARGKAAASAAEAAEPAPPPMTETSSGHEESKVVSRRTAANAKQTARSGAPAPSPQEAALLKALQGLR